MGASHTPFHFSSKSQNLKSLEGKIQSAKILPQYSFTCGQWKKNYQEVLKGFQALSWSSSPVVVRSSSQREDSETQSLAGAFESFLNRRGLVEVQSAIEGVIRSFGDDFSEGDEVFIQPFLEQVAVSGVCFSKDINNGNPYYVINYDDSSGKTDTVTSGETNRLKTAYIYKKHSPAKMPAALMKVVELSAELERITGEDALDLEFAVDKRGDLFLLQVRPLAKKFDTKINYQETTEILTKAGAFFDNLSQPHPMLYGKYTILGVMPDWNPAEIIGLKPRSLAFTLYKELITDAIWAYQRDNYGYKNLRSFPLIHDLGGHPYVDVRVCFNSFLPKSLSPKISEKLVNYYLDCLKNNPSLHDKVEFEIVFSCYSFDIDKRIEVLASAGFTKAEIDEIKESLKLLTNRIINSKDGLWRQDLEKVQQLESRRELVENSNLDTISKIYWLVEDCKRYGTLPFAGLARAGFMAIQILRSFVRVGIITSSEYDAFMLQLNTVGSASGTDILNLPKQEFLKKYGHLRPGTYEITSPRYDEAPDLYFDWEKIEGDRKGFSKSHDKRDFSLTLDQYRKIGEIIKENDLNMDPLEVFDFIKKAVEGRESSKFEFTKNVSLILKELENLGKQYGYSKEDLSYLDYRVIQRLYSSSESVDVALRESIAEGKKKHERTLKVCMPSLVSSSSDVFGFHLMECQPNFITSRRVRGESVLLKDLSENIEGKIVFIPSADPGFDWIFSKNIVGFITMFGGANSHMAIRAAELNMPAVIGAGEFLFKEWLSSNKIELDCLNQKVSIL